LTAAFVVGCDGAHSAVRHLLNLPFEGAAYDALFMLADIDTNDALPADELQLCPQRVGSRGNLSDERLPTARRRNGRPSRR
jgi:2-polyprenyl-6-methoxyphenol hydroxylase-like FAD-dependent oxidoreductase